MAHTVLSYDQFELPAYYEIDRLVDACVTGEHKRVALQFPDYLLADAPDVCFKLNAGLREATKDLPVEKQPICFVLGDTLFGSCCVDLIAAQHYGADALIHFGNACFTPSNKVTIPVYFVLDKCAVTDDGLEAVTRRLRRVDPNNALLVTYDPGFHYKAFDIIQAIYKQNPDRETYVLEAEVAVLPIDDSEEAVAAKVIDNNESLQKGKLCRRLLKKVDPATGALVAIDKLPEGVVDRMTGLLLGSEGAGAAESKFFESVILRNIVAPEWICVDLCTGEEIKMNPFKVASKRSYGIETIKKADAVGIVCCSPGLACAPLVQRVVARILRREGIVTHSIVMSKMTAGKLENFIDVDCFVQLGCPEHTVLPLSETRRPVVLPSDVIHAFEAREWDGGAILDLPEVLEIGSQFLVAKAKEDAELEAEKKKEEEQAAENKPVTTLATILSNERAIVVGRDLQERLVDVKSRSYSGVQFGKPDEAPQDFLIRKGKKGIANHYESDDRVLSGLPAEPEDQIYKKE